MSRRFRVLTLIVFDLAVAVCAAAAPLYPREGSTSDRVVYAYFARDTPYDRISVPVCDTARGAARTDCVNILVERVLPEPVKTFDPARVRRVVFIAVLAAPDEWHSRTMRVRGTILAPDGRQVSFNVDVPADRNTSQHVIQQVIPKGVLGIAVGEWSLLLTLDDALVGTYTFLWGDAAALGRLQKATEDALTSDTVAPPPVIPPELSKPQ